MALAAAEAERVAVAIEADRQDRICRFRFDKFDSTMEEFDDYIQRLNSVPHCLRRLCIFCAPTVCSR